MVSFLHQMYGTSNKKTNSNIILGKVPHFLKNSSMLLEDQGEVSQTSAIMKGSSLQSISIQEDESKYRRRISEIP